MSNARVLSFSITICVVAFIISKIIIAVLLYRRWQRKHMVIQDSFSGIVHLKPIRKLPKFGGKLVMFRSPKMKSLKYNTFLKKTMKLSNKDIIGSGGYGTVYKMTINDSIAFAVKRLNRGSGERDQGFERELEAMGDIKHRNIVTLHGYYTAPHYNLLIYELMPNGSLAQLLHDKTHVSTLIAGTFGYLAPEYFDTGKATAKGDVYSYGVVLLELLTGKKPTDEAFIEEGTKLVSWRDEGSESLGDHEASAEAFDVRELVEDVDYDVVQQTLELILCFFSIDIAHLSLYCNCCHKQVLPRSFLPQLLGQERVPVMIGARFQAFPRTEPRNRGSQQETLPDEAFPATKGPLNSPAPKCSRVSIAAGGRYLYPTDLSQSCSVVHGGRRRLAEHSSGQVRGIDWIRFHLGKELAGVEVKAVVQQNREELVLDSSLDCCPTNEINHVFNIALMCLEPEPSKRPTMAETVKLLEQKTSEKFVTDT
ncbi:hypothetical protein RHSIM_Rhsim06G0187700 [Rhododendron simsii]|uniref:Protein kinase domain-containing protein n=1 Tax=Rhododendron simsii TaxID=118357 RepID=A0A834LIX7_RHOSS|nr:hypothetical protein RHSIM_Rhsim06G0187700 [Rhododendron simsii]